MVTAKIAEKCVAIQSTVSCDSYDLYQKEDGTDLLGKNSLNITEKTFTKPMQVGYTS